MKQNKNTWFEDPEWEDLRRKINKEPALPKLGKKSKGHRDAFDGLSVPGRERQASQPEQSKDHEATDKKIQVSVNVSLPKIKKPTLTKKYKRIAIGLLVVVLLLAAAPLIRKTFFAKEAKDTQGVSIDVPQQPEFTPVLPDSLLEATTSKKTQYDPQKKVVSFTDKIDGISITVSEQALPENFKENAQSEVEKLAKTFSANEIVETKSGKAYIGTSVKGPQSAVLTKKNLLIFIYAEGAIENKSWATYIDNLL